MQILMTLVQVLLGIHFVLCVGVATVPRPQALAHGGFSSGTYPGRGFDVEGIMLLV